MKWPEDGEIWTGTSRKAEKKKMGLVSMLGMKTVISVPGVLFERADRLARKMKKSRSQLYSDAISEYVSRHDPAEVTKALGELYSRLDSRPHRSISEAARRVLVSTEW